MNLRIHTLGPFHVHRYNTPIPDSGWKTQKNQILLKILLTYRRRTLTKEQLMEWLWPAMGPDAAEVANEDPLAWPLAASGFRDTSRLASSDVTMMFDILVTNREQVGEMLQRYRRQLNRLIDLVENGHEDELRSVLEQAWQDRHAVTSYR